MSVRAPERAGYTTNVFILDCSASMSDVVPDPELDRDTASLAADGPTAVFGDASGPPAMKSKLQWAKEYVCRKILEQVRSLEALRGSDGCDGSSDGQTKNAR